MGWTSSNNWTTKQAVVDELQADLRSGGYQILDQASTASGWWAVITKPTVSDTREIFFALIERNSYQGVKAYAYKDMCEAMGPYHHDCPLRMLDLAPVKSPEWRERVVKFHATNESDRRAAKQVIRQIRPGMVVKLKRKSIPEIKIVSVENQVLWTGYDKPRRTVRVIVGEYDGRIYRITRASLKGAEIVQEAP